MRAGKRIIVDSFQRGVAENNDPRFYELESELLQLWGHKTEGDGRICAIVKSVPGNGSRNPPPEVTGYSKPLTRAIKFSEEVCDTDTGQKNRGKRLDLCETEIWLRQA